MAVNHDCSSQRRSAREGVAAVTDLAFARTHDLGEGASERGIEKDRVVAKATSPTRLRGDGAFDGATRVSKRTPLASASTSAQTNRAVPTPLPASASPYI